MVSLLGEYLSDKTTVITYRLLLRTICDCGHKFTNGVLWNKLSVLKEDVYGKVNG